MASTERKLGAIALQRQEAKKKIEDLEILIDVRDSVLAAKAKGLFNLCEHRVPAWQAEGEG